MYVWGIGIVAHTGDVGAQKYRLTQALAAYGDVVRSPSYSPLWVGQLLSSFGDTLHYITLVVLVFQFTGEGIAVAGLAAVEILPVLFLGPLAGVLIDRVSRKAVLVQRRPRPCRPGVHPLLAPRYMARIPRSRRACDR
jgi:hypothetical protein